jgi:fluoride exporter
MIKLIYLIAGGAIGTIARYGLSGLIRYFFSSPFPWGTLVVNLLGSLVIGFLWGLVEERNFHSGIRTFLFIGILGSFTTFSTFALETLDLFKIGETRLAVFNILITNVFGLVLVLTGYISAKGLITLFNRW